MMVLMALSGGGGGGGGGGAASTPPSPMTSNGQTVVLAAPQPFDATTCVVAQTPWVWGSDKVVVTNKCGCGVRSGE